MAKDEVQFFREGQILRNKNTNVLARLDGVLKMELVSTDSTKHYSRKRYVYKYILKSVSATQKTEVLNAKALMKDWAILIDTSILVSADRAELQRGLDVALAEENYELCAAIRDRLAVLK